LVVIREFRDFVAKGDVIMLAVGFIMGVAFAALVTSVVEDIIMPIIAIPFGEPDFSALTLEVNGSVIEYGSFLTAVTVFLLTAIGVFLFIVKPYNLWTQRRDEEDEVTGPSELEVLVEIRDALVDEKGN
jgi:large conductance mechanosensitive channel